MTAPSPTPPVLPPPERTTRLGALLDLILRTRGRVQTSCLDLAMASVRLPPAEERR